MKNLKSILVVAVMAIVVAVYVLGNTAIGNEFINDALLACSDCMIEKMNALACSDCMIEKINSLACSDCMIEKMNAVSQLA